MSTAGWLATVAAALAGVAVAGCGSSQHAAQPSLSHHITAATSASPSPNASGTPSPTARLTMRQAKAAYLRIIDPANRAIDRWNTDYTDAAPLALFRADTARIVVVERQVGRQMRAVRWPTKIQPYIGAMLLTYIPDSIACYRAIERAQSYDDARTINNTNQHCTAADADNTPDTIRSLLGLPNRSG